MAILVFHCAWPLPRATRFLYHPFLHQYFIRYIWTGLNNPLMEERILTLHPQGKSGVHILRHKYDQIKAALITHLQMAQPITFMELAKQIEQDLQGQFEGKTMWYVVAVKLDLEARGHIRRLRHLGKEKLEWVETEASAS